jgi:hypothetical protein
MTLRYVEQGFVCKHFVKGQTVNVLGLPNLTICVATTQFYGLRQMPQ